MRYSLGLALSMMLVLGAQGAECRLDQGTYTEPSGHLSLQFMPRQFDAPANQAVAFTLALSAGVTLSGGIYWPNGFSTPIYSLEGPCEAGGTETCDLLDGNGPAVYVLAGDGMARMPEDVDGPAPRQVLFPQLASALWYSSYRDSEFAGDIEPSEIFTLSGCAP